MTRFWEDYAQDEQQLAIDERASIQGLPTGRLWNQSEHNQVRKWLLNVGRMLIDLRDFTAEEHILRMKNKGVYPEYVHAWRMEHNALYVAAFLYTYDPAFRERADRDSTVYADVVAGYDRWESALESLEGVIANELTNQHPVSLASPAAPILHQHRFRGLNDDGGFNGTWKAELNTGWAQAAGVNFRVRFVFYNGHATNGWVGGFQLWCSKNGAPLQLVTGTSTVLRSAPSDYVADNASVTVVQALSVDSALSNKGTKLGYFDEVDGFSQLSLIPFGVGVEHEYCLQLVSGDVVPGDQVEIRARRGGGPGADIPLDFYSQVPLVTVS